MSDCLHCNRPMRSKKYRREERPGTILRAGRGLCHYCFARHRENYDTLRWRAPELMAEIDHMAGEPEESAARLGMNVASIARAARKAGRIDVARQYESVYNRQRRIAKREAGK